MNTSSTSSLGFAIFNNCEKFFVNLIQCSQTYFSDHPVPRVTMSASDYGGEPKTTYGYHTFLNDMQFTWLPEYDLLGSSPATCYICYMLELAAQGKQHHQPAYLSAIETHSFDNDKKSLKSSVVDIFDGRFKIEPLHGKNNPYKCYCWSIVESKKADLNHCRQSRC